MKAAKKWIKYVALILMVVLVVIQFIHPDKNLSGVAVDDISRKFPVPDSIQKILTASCYDCHSNHTEYPWYSKIQPVDWWLTHHINDGKRGLNFNEFSSYPIAKEYKRLNDIAEMVGKRSMPLPSYTWIHRYAILDDGQIAMVKEWTNAMRENIKAKYPADSLIMPKKPGH